MGKRYFALAVGIVFLLLGVTGFIPNLVQLPPATAPELVVGNGYGYLLGLFPVNILHNIVHLAVGIAGILAYRSADGARLFARFFAISYAALALLGAFPTLNTLFGFVPIFGNNVWFNGLTAAIAAYFGFIAPTLGEAGVVK